MTTSIELATFVTKEGLDDIERHFDTRTYKIGKIAVPEVVEWGPAHNRDDYAAPELPEADLIYSE